MDVRLSDWPVYLQVCAMDRAGRVAEAARRRLEDVRRDERGQTSTEYLMIVGIMAAVILLAFVTFFWGTIRDAASTWATKVADAIRGEGVN